MKYVIPDAEHVGIQENDDVIVVPNSENLNDEQENETVAPDIDISQDDKGENLVYLAPNRNTVTVFEEVPAEDIRMEEPNDVNRDKNKNATNDMNTVIIKDFESDEIVVLGQNAATVNDMEIHNRDIRREDRNEILAIDANIVKVGEFEHDEIRRQCRKKVKVSTDHNEIITPSNTFMSPMSETRSKDGNYVDPQHMHDVHPPGKVLSQEDDSHNQTRPTNVGQKTPPGRKKRKRKN